MLSGDRRHSIGEAIVRDQGLWALVALVVAEAPSVAPVRIVTGSTVSLPTAPVSVCGALLAAWADLVVAVVRRTEAS